MVSGLEVKIQKYWVNFKDMVIQISAILGRERPKNALLLHPNN